MMDRQGILPSSPLRYAVASVRFAPWGLVGKRILEIHESLRHMFPLFHKVQVQFDGSVPGPNDQSGRDSWVLVSGDRNFCVQISQDQILFVAKKYKRYADFSASMREVLSVVHSEMRSIIDVVNMGVRYVDVISMLDGEGPSDYVSDGLLPLGFDGVVPVGGEVFVSYAIEDSQLRVRCTTLHDSPNVPFDLMAPLAVSSGVVQGIEFKQLGSREFMLDMDSVKVFAEPARMAVDEILEQLDALHSKANLFFRSAHVCTEHAFKRWKSEAI